MICSSSSKVQTPHGVTFEEEGEEEEEEEEERGGRLYIRIHEGGIHIDSHAV